MNEFEMIQKYFLPLTHGRAEAAGLSDDAAILKVPVGYDLVISSDTLNGGTHFLKNESPANIAHKVLRVNLSDMVAMGAKPYCYQMNLAFSEFPDEAWVKEFTAALAEDQKEFDVFCSGGDTTVAEGPLLVSLTITGLVPSDKAVRRSGAKAGDLVVVTGFIGDAAVGVKVLLGTLDIVDSDVFLQACHKPTPRVALSAAICEYANAAVDVSDGLLADLGHICETSKLRAAVELSKIPFSPAAKALVDVEKITAEALITGGDDYEIAMAVAPEKLAGFQRAAEAAGVRLSVIGRFEEGEGVEVLDENGKKMSFKRSGWTHF